MTTVLYGKQYEVVSVDGPVIRVRKLSKHNPNHDELGRFSSGEGGGFGSAKPKDFIAARDASKRMGFMSPLVPADLADHNLLINDDSTIGVAVDKHGDIQNVFNNGGPKGGAGKALVAALNNGGKTLDCFDGFLPSYYSQFGFAETARMKFDPAHAPDAWDHEKYDSPDVVFMAWKGYPHGGADAAVQRAGKPDAWLKPERASNYVTDYDQAKSTSRAAAYSPGTGGAGRGSQKQGASAHKARGGVDLGTGADAGRTLKPKNLKRISLRNSG